MGQLAERSPTIHPVHSVLKQVGFDDCVKITDSLQGSVWRATQLTPDGQINRFVIKTANQFLYAHSKGLVHGKSYQIKEDIVLEQSILKYLTQDTDCPNSIVKWHHFFKTNTDLFLVMEDAGSSLFDFITKAHNLVRTNKIDAKHWRDVCHVLLQQMVEAIAYIHSKHVAHFDISLENWLINDIKIEIDTNDEHERIRFVMDDIELKLCDFGLAQIFTNQPYLSSKFCGKQGYKSPEIVNKKKGFDAQLNDIWCLGMCMFMVCVGVAPWAIAHESDTNFAYFMKYGMRSVLKQWDCLHYVDPHMLYLLQATMQYEEERVSLSQIQQYLSMWLH
eukprot:374234_1